MHQGRAIPDRRKCKVAILSERINILTDHFKTHTKDNHSRRGLLEDGVDAAFARSTI